MAEAAEVVLAGKGWLAAVASGRVVVNPTYRLQVARGGVGSRRSPTGPLE
jgi:hypothetical protein